MDETQLYFWGIICLLGLGGLIPLAVVVFRQKPDRSINESLVQSTSPDHTTIAGKQKLGRPTSVSLWLALIGSGLITFYALKILIGGGPAEATLLPPQHFVDGLPAIALSVYIDHLAAFFLLLIGGLSLGIAFYSFNYLRKEPDRLQIAGAYNLFVLSGVMFVIANNVFFFLLVLECTTLTFGSLVLHKHYKNPIYLQHQQAIKTYLITNHIGGIFVLAALVILALSQHPVAIAFDMNTFRDPKNITDQSTANLVFLLALIGFSIKAGIAPFHIWVSIAHPSSPTNTHAMSLGIMIKIALYGMIRVFFQFLHPLSIPWWWGFTVLLVAALTAVIGVRNALYGRTLKDSLADHSVENIGIILAGIGLALIFASYRDSPVYSLTGLALVAGLYHLLNHTVFKGLLYLCTGAVDWLTDEVVELKRLGGLIHRFRWTSACFLVGSVAIAGFPPFNGFISEWLMLQTLIVGLNLLAANQSPNWLLLAGMILSTLLLASAFALTAFAFVKIAGEAFLGKPRNEAIASAFAKSDVPWSMRGVMIVLAVLCLLLGLFPWLVMMALGIIVSDLHLPLNAVSPVSFLGGIAIKTTSPQYLAQLQPEFLFTLFGLVLFIFPLAMYISRTKQKKVVWAGGSQYHPASMQYTSSTFTSPIREFLGRTFISVLLTPIIQSQIVKPLAQLPEEPSVVSKVQRKRGVQPIKIRFKVSKGRWVGEPFRQVYSGLINLLRSIAQSTGSIVQNGDLRRYLLYIFIFFITVFILIGLNR